MTATGLVGVPDPSALFGRSEPGEVGAAVTCVLEGTRPLLIEIQALVAPTDLAMPRRVATGVDPKRLAMIVAVLGRHAGLALGAADVFVNVAGGVRDRRARSRPRRSRSRSPPPPAASRSPTASPRSARSASRAACGPARRRPGASRSARSSGSPPLSPRLAPRVHGSGRIGSRGLRRSPRGRGGLDIGSRRRRELEGGCARESRAEQGFSKNPANMRVFRAFLVDWRSSPVAPSGRRRFHDTGEGVGLYKVGDKVVYPHHGAGTIVKREQREVLGETREYLTIKILHNDMTVNVPADNAERVGLRKVIDEEAVKKVVKYLTSGGTEMPKNWNRRFKHNRDKMKTGDIFELAEVVRNLSLRDGEKGLSTGEKQMYVKAKKILASELMYAKNLSEDDAFTWLEGVLTAGDRSGQAARRRSGRSRPRSRSPPSRRHRPPRKA